MSTTPSQPPHIFSRYPALRGTVAWTCLGKRVTPVEPVTLGADPHGGMGDVWVKRDDLSAEAYGGNKVRKLEFILGEALEARAGHLVTGGAMGSHHALATAIYGREHGLGTTAILFPQEVTPHVREVLAAQAAAGTDLRLIPRMEMLPLAMRLARLRRRRENALLVPPGGSNVAGALGFVNAAFELAEQINNGLCPCPKAIYTPSGTLGTAAGLAVGLTLANLDCQVVSVRVLGRLGSNRGVLRRIVGGVLARLSEAGLSVPQQGAVLRRIEWRDDQFGAGYGRPTEAGVAAAKRFAEAGLVLDPTYTAKAAAALLDDRAGGRDGPLLFWHTLSATQPDLHPDPASVLPRAILRRLRAKR